MALSALESGSRMQIALSPKLGEEAKFEMVTTFFKMLDESSFLISIPMQGGKALEIDENQKLLLRYPMADDYAVLVGYRDDTVKIGIRRYWKIRRVSEQRQFVQRVDERLKVSLRAEYCQPTWEMDDNGKILKDDAMTMDISVGGVALFVNRRFEVGEMCLLSLPRVGGSPAGAAMPDVPCMICWQRETPRGSLYRNLCGLQFSSKNPVDKERVAAYVAEIKSIYKL